MRTRPSVPAAVIAVLSLAACGRKEGAPPPENQAAQEKSATAYYYDLGSPSVDASGYPEKQKENYRFFLAVCGSCHTPARPLNSPHVDRDVWARYVRRMHLKMSGRGIELAKSDEDRIVDFLVYDSQIRKVGKRADFDSRQKELKELFEKETAAQKR